MTTAKKKILIVEDETAFLYAMQSKLSLKGYEVITATLAEDGLSILAKEKVDLIILDVILPKMDGFDFLREIKSKKETQAIPVVIASNISSKQNIDSGIELGAKDYLVKSEYNLDGIVSKIEELIK
ncbi:MAG: response regulator [Patescibacteria group bacterium]